MMRATVHLALIVMTCLTACGQEASPAQAGVPKPRSEWVETALEQLHREIAELAARPEHTATRVRVQHLLVAFQGAPMVMGVTRTREQAEQLTADLLKRIQDGEEFAELVEEYSSDQPPGVYEMTTATRATMQPAFGDVAWRLTVGEVGVAPHDPERSPYGWHIIKRLD